MNPARILIVEDDPSVRSLIVDILEKQNLTIDTANDGFEALEKIRSCDYAVILLDLMMPRINGVQVAEKLREIQSRCKPIVFLLTAGHVLEELPADVVHAVIHKPFDIDLLGDLIGCAVRAYEEVQQGTGGASGAPGERAPQPSS